jgi:hypothetical protein
MNLTQHHSSMPAGRRQRHQQHSPGGSLQVRDDLGVSSSVNVEGSGGIEDGGGSGYSWGSVVIDGNVDFIASSKSRQSGINVVIKVRTMLRKEIQERVVGLLAQLASMNYDVARQETSGDIKRLTEVGAAKASPSGATVGAGGGAIPYAMD